MSFDEEPDAQDWEELERKDDFRMLDRIWELAPDIKTMQFSKMVFDNDIIAIGKAAIQFYKEDIMKGCPYDQSK